VRVSEPHSTESRDVGSLPDTARDGNENTGGGAQPAQSERPIRVLSVDDHEFVRRGLRALLTADPRAFEICGEASGGHEAVRMTRDLRPDVVVLDVSMPGLNGLETTRLIAKEDPRPEILILTMHESEQM